MWWGVLKKLRRVLKERVETVNLSQRLVDSAACVVAAEDELSPQLRRMLEASGQAVPAARPILEINASTARGRYQRAREALAERLASPVNTSVH